MFRRFFFSTDTHVANFRSGWVDAQAHMSICCSHVVKGQLSSFGAYFFVTANSRSGLVGGCAG